MPDIRALLRPLDLDRAPISNEVRYKIDDNRNTCMHGSMRHLVIEFQNLNLLEESLFLLSTVED